MVDPSGLDFNAERLSFSIEPAHGAIAARAYGIFLQRNGGPGDALSDWLQAERELRGSLPASAENQERSRATGDMPARVKVRDRASAPRRGVPAPSRSG